MKRISFILLCGAMLSLVACTTKTSEKSEVLDLIVKVNTYWQKNNPEHKNAFWHRAAYHIGNLDAYNVTGNESFRQYTEAWAEHNEWKGAKSDDTTEWRYSYGENDKYVLFGDWQACFQVYCDLYTIEPQEYKIARARQVMEYEMSTPNNDYWWWCDGLFMVMPVMTKLYDITNNSLYLDKLYEYITYTDSLMFDYETGLYFRDAKYVYPKHQSINGKKDFWARGDGWVLAGLAKVLSTMPVDNANRDFFLEKYKKLASSVKSCQQPEGYWTRSMLDSEHAPGPETSGTAFFAYGLMWGVNNGFLDKNEYSQTIENAWGYLKNTAVQPDGRVGYVQPIGERAIPGQVVDANSTADFGVGAFLMAACERVRYLN